MVLNTQLGFICKDENIKKELIKGIHNINNTEYINQLCINESLQKYTFFAEFSNNRVRYEETEKVTGAHL